MRPGEVLAMTAAQIDRTDPSCWKYAPTHHKTIHKGHSRVIFLGTRAQEIVLPRILRSGSGELFPMTRAALRRAIHRGCRRAYPHPTLSGIAKDKLTAAERAELKGWIKAHSWHPNQIRHTVATNVRANYGLEAAQVLLGHSKADTTQVYAERDMTKAADVARRIG
jgi:integrase